MIKNQRGITLIALTVTVLVLLILGATVIRESTILIDSSRMRKYITIMSLVRVEVEKIFEDFEFENDASNLEDSDLTKLTSMGGEKITLSPNERIPGQYDLSDEEQDLIIENIELAEDPDFDGVIDVDVDNLWYKWPLSVIENLNIDHSNLLTNDEYFIINYATGDIIFSRSIKMENGEHAFSLIGLKKLDNYEEN